MLLSVTLLAFLLIYLLLPPFYLNRLEEDVRLAFDEQVSQLEMTENLAAELRILNQFFSHHALSFLLIDETGETLGGMTQQGSFTLWEEFDQTDEYGLNKDTTDELDASNSQDFFIPDDGEAVMIEFHLEADLEIELSYYLADYGLRTVLVTIPISPLGDALLVMSDIYPIVLLLCLIFALVVAFIFSNWVVNPMKKIRLATSKMIKLQPDVTIEAHKSDEIGGVIKDVNHLYQQLRMTISSLETEITKYSDAENQKIEFLQTVSHEMKAPLVTASALTDGMIHNIPPYDENKEEHLKELKFFLEKTVQLTKESLDLSQKYKEETATYALQDLVEEVSKTYRIIFASKQLHYLADIPENIQITTKSNIFSKVLSNLFSNAANYSDTGGSVHVRYDKGILSIRNTCTPLAEEAIAEIFKPLTVQGVNEHSTGLGLFIVQQLLLQLQIPYSFTETSDGSGMVFKFYLPDEKS